MYHNLFNIHLLVVLWFPVFWNKVPINIHVQVFLRNYIFISLGQTPRNEGCTVGIFWMPWMKLPVFKVVVSFYLNMYLMTVGMASRSIIVIVRKPLKALQGFLYNRVHIRGPLPSALVCPSDFTFHVLVYSVGLLHSHTFHWTTWSSTFEPYVTVLPGLQMHLY